MDTIWTLMTWATCFADALSQSQKVFQATSFKRAQRQSSSAVSFAVNSETPVVPSLPSSGPVLPGLGAPTTTR